MDKVKVAVLGGSGYTAVELLKILLRHPHAEVVAVTTRDKELPRVADLHPVLGGRLDLRCEPFDPDALAAKGVKCAFGCLPHGVSMETIPPLLDRGIRVVDLSADYRLRDPNVYAEWYGESHHDLAYLAQALYAATLSLHSGKWVVNFGDRPAASGARPRMAVCG
jgi:N-acetyl-gamma-glutamyl-phosphate reductase